MDHGLAKVPLEPEDTRGHNPLVRQAGSRPELLKRLLDIVLSLLGLFLAAPLMAIIALFIKLISPGPVFLRGTRGVGSDEKPYWYFKFRTLHCRHYSQPMRPNDSRLMTRREPMFIPLGRFLRETGIEDMPMLICVMLGSATFFDSPHHPGRECSTVRTEELGLASETERRIGSLAYWIPRKYREAIVGDVLEDCRELRELGKSEWRIRIHVIWQLVWALILLRPTALMDALKRILSTK